jgi:hypothetical protein
MDGLLLQWTKKVEYTYVTGEDVQFQSTDNLRIDNSWDSPGRAEVINGNGCIRSGIIRPAGY